MVWLAGCQGLPKPSSTATTGDSIQSPTTPIITTTGNQVQEILVQGDPSSVDLLLVVQNTPGLLDTQQTFADNLPILLDFFLGSGVDYRIGVISADTSDPATAGVLVEAGSYRWVDANTPDSLSTLWQMSALGESAAISAPMGAVYAALETQRDQANAGFYREDTLLAVVVLSDGLDSTDPAELTDGAFVAWMSGLKSNSRPSYACLLDGDGPTCGLLAQQLGGHVGEVTDLDLYEAIGVDAVGLQRSFPISRDPVPGTLEVEVFDPFGGVLLAFEPATLDAYGNVVDGDWLYDPANKVVSFVQFIPNPGSEIRIRYEAAVP